MFRKTFSEGRIGTLITKNRLVAAPMVSMYMNEDGSTTKKFLDYYEEKAKGGYGVVIVENYPVLPHTGGFKVMGAIYTDELMKDHAQLPERLHKYGAKAILQLYHAGREAPQATTGVVPAGPSAIQEPSVADIPHELSVEEIHEIVKAFGICALNAKRAGFDGVEVHGAHGYLLHQFLSPLANKRVDEYGGTYVNKFRIVKEIVQEIKKLCGDDYPIFFRISAQDEITGGQTIEDTKIYAMMAEEAGICCIDISTGTYASGPSICAPYSTKIAWMQDYAAEVKKVVDLPVIIVNKFNDPYAIEMVLKEEKADFVAMARGSLADPYFPNKARDGEYEDIVRCIGCMQECIGRQVQGLSVGCLVNPTLGKNEEYAIIPVERPKKLAVIGGGPAGMEAAIVAAKRGHKVTLYEARERLGGQWYVAAIPPGKEQYNTFTIWQAYQLEKWGVEVHLNTVVNDALIQSMDADEVIVATGSRHVLPDVPGIHLPFVCDSDDVLLGRVNPGKRCVVVGGGNIGAETAEHLGVHERQVTITTRQDELMRGLEVGPRTSILDSMKKHNVSIRYGMQLIEVREGSAIFSCGGERVILEADTLVIAGKLLPEDSLLPAVRQRYKNAIVIGDAKEVGRAPAAIREGYEAGLTV